MSADDIHRRLDALWRMESPRLLARLSRITGDIATAEELDGVPQDVVQAAQEAAQAEGKPGYKLTLKMPCYLPVMQFARQRARRERLYRAHVTRASDQAEGDATRFDNAPLIRDILALRLEEAQLLGYANYAEVSRQPPAIRDLAIVVDQKLELQQLIDGITNNRPALIQDIRLFDVYTGKGVESGKKSLAFRIVMQDTQRTLQDAEVDAAVQELIAYVQLAFSAQLRA